MNAIRNMAAALLCVLTLTGCATFQLINSLHSQGYGGNWVIVDMTKTNAPSGGHLLGLLSADSAAVRLLVSQHGTPDYIRHDDPNRNISRVSFVFLKDNLFVVLDRISGQRQDKILDEVYENDLPPQYVSLKKQRQEEQRRQEVAEREARAKKEQMEREAKEKSQREAAAEQARKEKEARVNEGKEETTGVKPVKMIDPNALVVKGLYIDMDISEAAQQITANFPKGTILKRDRANFYTITDQSIAWLPMGYIWADDNGKVNRIEFSTMAADNVFKASELEPSEFAKKFAASYKIPSLKPNDSWDGWFFTSPAGYKITITDDKEVIIEKTANSKELNDAFN